MWELIGQIVSVVLNSVGHARGRFSGRILLGAMLVVMIGCSVVFCT